MEAGSFQVVESVYKKVLFEEHSRMRAPKKYRLLQMKEPNRLFKI